MYKISSRCELFASSELLHEYTARLKQSHDPLDCRPHRRIGRAEFVERNHEISISRLVILKVDAGNVFHGTLRRITVKPDRITPTTGFERCRDVHEREAIRTDEFTSLGAHSRVGRCETCKHNEADLVHCLRKFHTAPQIFRAIRTCESKVAVHPRAKRWSIDHSAEATEIKESALDRACGGASSWTATKTGPK